MKAQIPLWRKVQKENITNLATLSEFLQLTDDQKNCISKKPNFILNLPLRLAKKIVKGTLNDPIFRQFVPLIDEEIKVDGFSIDPVEDRKFKKTPKLLHKYHGRALIVTSSACAMHCRYCFRQNFPYETETKSFEKEIEYLTKETSIKEVILSGGDPLSLSTKALESLLKQIDSIDHIERIRFHSRFLVGIPERIDQEFLDLLKMCQKQVFFIVHINHPIELDRDVRLSLKNIQKLGIPVLNQSVLLKGVNDSESIQYDLSQALLQSGVLPYYLHTLDPVQGTSHFAIPIKRGIEIVQSLQKRISGFGVPKLAKEEPGKPSKTFITP